MTKKALLIVNLGTPTAPKYWALRKYLKQFLSDSRVVDKNRIFWLTLLNLVLLQIIPQRSAKNYAKIWNKETNESPLFTFTKSKVKKLQKQMQGWHVDYAFTYDAGRADRSIDYKLKEFTDNGYQEITILPVYPQYSVSTTASVFDQAGNFVQNNNINSKIKKISHYFEKQVYIDALVNSIEKTITYKTTDLVCSFHGVPVSYIKKGDVYEKHCIITHDLLSQTLKSRGIDINTHLTYQSQFGKDEWLGPKTDATLAKLAKNGVENVAVITPGFAVDCIETLEEIAMEAKEEFIENGGKKFIFVPCLNDSDDAITMYKEIVGN